MIEFEKREKSNVEKIIENLEELDSTIFPEKPLLIKQGEIMEAEAVHHFDKDEQGNLINHYYGIKKGLDEQDETSLFGIASHEVRHRAQHQKLNEIFTEKNLHLLDEIEYEPLKKYSQENKKEVSKLVKDIIQEIEDEKGRKLSGNDYDAVVVEALAKFLKRDGIPTSKIALFLIAKEPREIKKGFEMIQKT